MKQWQLNVLNLRGDSGGCARVAREYVQIRGARRVLEEDGGGGGGGDARQFYFILFYSLCVNYVRMVF